MRSPIPAVLLLWASTALAQLPPVPEPLARPDESPTAFACTAQTLGEEKGCTLEAEPSAASDRAKQSKQNVEAAAALANAACERASKADAATPADSEVSEGCRRTFAAAAEAHCSLGGATALFGEGGAFAKGAQECYGALSAVLRRARMSSRLAAPCCRCLSSQCGTNVAACRETVLDTTAVPEQTLTCLKRPVCRAECAPLMPREGAPPTDGGSKTKEKTTWL